MKKDKKLILIIYLFCLLYYPPILQINFHHIVAMVGYIFLLNNMRFLSKVGIKKIIILCTLFLCLSFLLLLSAILASTNFNLMWTYILFILEIVPSCLAASAFANKYKMTSEDFLFCVLMAGILQGILSVLAFAFPDFQRMLIGKTITYGFNESKFKGFIGRRYYGISYNLVSYGSILQAFLAVIALRCSLKKNIKYFLAMLILGFSAFVNSRTAILVFGVGVLMVLAEQYKEKKIVTSVKSTARKVGIFLLSTISVILVCIQIRKLSSKTFEWISVGLSDVLYLIQNRELIGGFSYMINIKNKLPKGIDLIFGIGEMSLGGNSVGVVMDMGYINYLWMGGVVFALFIHFVFLYIILKIRKYNQNNDEYVFISHFVLLVFLIYNLKVPIFLIDEMSILLVLFYVYSSMRKSKIA